MPLVGPAKVEAEPGGFLYILGIGSPTRWSEEVRSFMDGSRLGLASISHRLALCMMDGVTEECLYDHSDPRLSDAVKLFILDH